MKLSVTAAELAALKKAFRLSGEATMGKWLRDLAMKAVKE